MRARSTPRLAALAVLTMVVGSAVGSRDPASAVTPLQFAVPTAVVTPATPAVVIDEQMDAALARQLEAAAVEAAAERARLAAELDHLWSLWILNVYDRIGARTGRWLPWPTVALIIEAAVRQGVDPVLVGKIGACESGGRADAWNPSGASGFGQHLAQYWPGRAAAAGLPGASPFDLAANIEVTAWYLARAGTSPWNPSRYCWS